VVASVLLTVGELAKVAGPSLRPHIGDLLPLIIDAVVDPAASHKRNVAVVTLGQVWAMTLATKSARGVWCCGGGGEGCYTINAFRDYFRYAKSGS